MRHPGTPQGTAMSLVLACALLAISCGSGGTRPSDIIAPSRGTTYVFIGDAPPSGSGILKCEITLSQAELCPTVSPTGECQGTPVALLSAPVDIDLNQLQLGSAFLSLKSVTAGTYGGVRLTFSNPQLEIMLADGSVEELEGANLPLSPAAVTPSFASALTVAANSSVSFLIDFNVLDSIQSSSGAVTGISPDVSLALLPVPGAQAIEDLPDTTGQTSSVSKSCPTGSLTLTDSMTGLAIANIQFDGTTEFDGGLTCETLADNQTAEADVQLQSTSQGPQFFAAEIELVGDAEDEGLEGVVFRVASTSQFVLLVNSERNLAGLSSGSFVTIDADPARVVYGLDSTDLAVSSDDFASGADLFVGQTVDVEVTPGSLVTADTGCADFPNNCTASAEKVRLKKSTLTALVTGTSDPNFTLINLPILFGSLDRFRQLSADCQSCSVGSMTVVTSDQTEFENATGGFSALQVGDNVTVRGFIVKDGFAGPGPPGSGSPQLVAAKVRRLTP
jgi:hypothetical protein